MLSSVHLGCTVCIEAAGRIRSTHAQRDTCSLLAASPSQVLLASHPLPCMPEYHSDHTELHTELDAN